MPVDLNGPIMYINPNISVYFIITFNFLIASQLIKKGCLSSAFLRRRELLRHTSARSR